MSDVYQPNWYDFVMRDNMALKLCRHSRPIYQLTNDGAALVSISFVISVCT